MIFIGVNLKESDLEPLNDATNKWTLNAARGECGWICSDCCCSFPKGMPDECVHGDDRCTNIIKRDKLRGCNTDIH